MIKKISLLLLVIGLTLVMLSSGLVQAGSGITVLSESVDVEFPLRLNFSLSAQSDADIADVRLHYRVDRISSAEVTSEVYLEFVPGTTVDVSWTLETVRIGGLPPGSGVDYWWTVQDAAGDEIKTTPLRVKIDDNRYSWQSLTEGMITIYWYEGEQAFAQEIMDTAQQALTLLSEDTGAYLERPARLYVYANYQDLKGAMIYPQEWTGGAAFTRFGVIAIGISPENLGWGKRAIAHELAHLVIHQMTLNPYGGLPTWLDEGLAMYAEAEGVLDLAHTAYLYKAVADQTFITVRSLSSPFSAYAEEAGLSYAQSYSLVQFLISSYGQSRMLELLNTFRQGSTYDGALEQVYGFGTDGLDTLWRDYITELAQRTSKVGVEPALIGAAGDSLWRQDW